MISLGRHPMIIRLQVVSNFGEFGITCTCVKISSRKETLRGGAPNLQRSPCVVSPQNFAHSCIPPAPLHSSQKLETTHSNLINT